MADGLSIFTLVVIIVPLSVALVLGFAPLLPSLRRWGETKPARMLSGVFILTWFLSWIAITGFFARILYSIASFYFDTTFGQAAGATRAVVQSHTWNMLTEIWLRGLLGWFLPSKCFATVGMTCQLADEAAKLGSLGISPAVVAIFPALFTLLIARWIVSRGSRRRVQAPEVEKE